MYAHEIQESHGNDQFTFSSCPILLFFVIIAGLLVLGLGCLRVYSFRLEFQLAKINSRIAKYEKSISQYEQHMATLRSPTHVHHFASVSLGMQGTSDIPTVHVASRPGNDNTLVSVEENHAPVALFNLFTRPANADD